MARADKVLVGATVAVIVFGLASLPFRPFLLASHPVLLSLATGSLSAIGAGAAFATGRRHRALAGDRRRCHRNDQVRLVVLVGGSALGREGCPLLRAQRAGAALRRARPVLAHLDHAAARGRRGPAGRPVPARAPARRAGRDAAAHVPAGQRRRRHPRRQPGRGAGVRAGPVRRRRRARRRPLRPLDHHRDRRVRGLPRGSRPRTGSPRSSARRVRRPADDRFRSGACPTDRRAV